MLAIWSIRDLLSLWWSGTTFRAHFSLDNGLELITTRVGLFSDRRSFRSETCVIRGDFRYIMGFERSLVWSEDTLVWDGLIRGQFCLGRSDQKKFRFRPQPGQVSRALYWCMLVFGIVIHFDIKNNKWILEFTTFLLDFASSGTCIAQKDCLLSDCYSCLFCYFVPYSHH